MSSKNKKKQVESETKDDSTKSKVEKITKEYKPKLKNKENKHGNFN